MERLYEIFNIKLRNIPIKFKRFLFHQIDWDNRLISILGARGTGKTTLVMQHIKQQFKQPSKQILFADVNHIYFTTHRLMDLADQFYKKGEADLSRRVVGYLLPGLSFREFLELNNDLKFDTISLSSVLNYHLEFSYTIASDNGTSFKKGNRSIYLPD